MGRDTPTVPLRHSLLARVVLALGLFMALLGTGLYLSIEHFVSAQFRAVHGAEARQFAARIGEMARDELERFDGMARLLAADADLGNATWYHLFLEGERDHPQAAVERIARAFRLHTVILHDAEGGPVARFATGAEEGAAFFAAQSGRLHWQGGRAWAVARAPLMREGRAIAHLVLARPADELFPRNFLDRHEARAEFTPARPDGLSIELPAGERPVWLRLELPDTVGQALAEVNRLVAAGVAAAGLLLVAGFTAFLRWQMAPLRELTQAAAAIGRGEFGRVLDAGGQGEIPYVVKSFNAMSAALVRLRDMERRVAHQEQLSAIGRVAARVAHDINNPLTVIGNTARLMQRETAEARLRADLELIRHHCQRCMDTVRALLEFGRPVKVDARPLELAAWLREAAARWKVGAGDTALELELPEGGLWALADPLPLEQLLANLLDNARQANSDGPIRLRAGQDAGGIRVEVADSGPGFAPEARAHLFEPFFTTKAGGTGLGLASALAVARAHGGDIEIGGEGAGGRVSVRLPAMSA
jgi:signal transduction histidine kinase